MTIEVDTEVRRLLFEHVTTYEQLEALLLAHARPRQAWTVTAVADALRIDVPNALASLVELVAHRLLVTDANPSAPQYRYAAAGTDMGRAVDQLALAYSGKRLEIIKLMSANAIERMRSSTARAFSDAFIFRRKKDDR